MPSGGKAPRYCRTCAASLTAAAPPVPPGGALTRCSVAGLATGQYDYQILYTNPGDNSPYATGTGFGHNCIRNNRIHSINDMGASWVCVPEDRPPGSLKHGGAVSGSRPVRPARNSGG